MIGTSGTFGAALGLAVAFGVSPYATLAILGIAQRIGWVAPLPLHLSAIANPWVITVAAALTVIEFGATLVPGMASAWEAIHTMLRPPAAAVMAVLVMWGGGPAVVLLTAALAASVAFGTSFTKLGARLAIDTSPEPVSNGVANVAELTFVALLTIFVWQRPGIVVTAALVSVAATALFVRAVWGMIWKTVVRARRPGVRSLRS